MAGSPSSLLLVAAVTAVIMGPRLLGHLVEALPGGAPQGACATLSPSADQHGAGPQTTAVPYAVNISSMSDGAGGYAYVPGEVYPSM